MVSDTTRNGETVVDSTRNRETAIETTPKKEKALSTNRFQANTQQHLRVLRLLPESQGKRLPFTVLHVPYRGTSLIRNTHPDRITVGPKAQGYCRVLRGGGSYEGTPVFCRQRTAANPTRFERSTRQVSGI